MEYIFLKTGKRYKMANIEADLRYKYNISYLASGMRRDETFSRRGQLAHIPSGIDEKYKKLYPVINFSKKDIYSYVKLHKLPLPIEYNTGKERDFWVPAASDLVILKHNFSRDYAMIIEEFPHLDAIRWGAENE